MFSAFAKELKALTGSLGVKNLQDIVGRSDLLQQSKGQQSMDLTYLLKNLDITPFSHKETAAYLNEGSMQVAVGAEYLDSHVDDLQQSRNYSSITSEQRVLGSRVSCHRVRGRLDGSYKNFLPFTYPIRMVPSRVMDLGHTIRRELRSV